jgi:flagellar biosynthesis/type III secretory pathway M-ring protein FliF/YscJ
MSSKRIQTTVPSQNPTREDKASTPLETKIEIEATKTRIIELVQKDPQKAALILTDWINRNHLQRQKRP